MRRVLSSIDEVAHVWANQQQGTGQTGNGSLYFWKNHIYSWGEHYICGAIVKNRKGEKIYVTNNTTWSVSTSRHMSAVHNAIPAGSTVLEAPVEVLGEHFSLHYRNGMFDLYAVQAIITDLCETIYKCLDKQSRARTTSYHGQVQYHLDRLNDWIEAYEWDKDRYFVGNNKKRQHINISKLKEGCIMESVPKTTDSVQHEAHLKALFLTLQAMNFEIMEEEWLQLASDWKNGGELRESADKFAKLSVDQFKNRKILLQKQLEQNAKKEFKLHIAGQPALLQKLEQWRAFEERSWHEHIFLAPKVCWDTGLRLSKGGTAIETSKGMFIPIDEAKRLYRYVQHIRQNGFKHELAMDLYGHRWHINDFQDDILYAGCHLIHISEIEKAYQQLIKAEEKQ